MIFTINHHLSLNDHSNYHTHSAISSEPADPMHPAHYRKKAWRLKISPLPTKDLMYFPLQSHFPANLLQDNVAKGRRKSELCEQLFSWKTTIETIGLSHHLQLIAGNCTLINYFFFFFFFLSEFREDKETVACINYYNRGDDENTDRSSQKGGALM